MNGFAEMEMMSVVVGQPASSEISSLVGPCQAMRLVGTRSVDFYAVMHA